MDKAALRKEALARRIAMSPAEAAINNARIAAHLRAMAEYARARTCLFYVSSKHNEVDTHALIRESIAAGKRVLVPIAEPGGLLLWSRLESLAEVAPARFGILEPRAECRRLETPPPEAVAIVPLVAFTPACYRIGYGGGYYDRFLAGFEGVSIGLAFDVQRIDAFTPASHDVPLDYIVTESGVLKR